MKKNLKKLADAAKHYGPVIAATVAVTLVTRKAYTHYCVKVPLFELTDSLRNAVTAAPEGSVLCTFKKELLLGTPVPGK